MGWAVRHPRVKRLVIPIPRPFPSRVNAIAAFDPPLPQYAGAFASAASMLSRSSQAVAPRQRLPPAFGAYTFPMTAGPTGSRRFASSGHSPGAPGSLVRRVSGRRPVCDSLRSRPMLICWGERDFVATVTSSPGWMRRFPEAKCIDFRRRTLFVGGRTDRVVPLVHSFLTEISWRR